LDKRTAQLQQRSSTGLLAALLLCSRLLQLRHLATHPLLQQLRLLLLVLL
jgi:hypothetical protein